ncbi:glycosyl hydrolase [Fibrobacter intestinalis]|uniref:Mannan endo-1,4-beta-mannosidase n=1 Tax=Fibrobacter intestinalis TaxID=28122 RepID=A0A1T4S3Z6_9BACT|nr:MULTISPECIES: glycosyl hydrolase [Fibrobacter]PBC72817.1 mannan endo-1,4-beta-mannosidase [Fibrobacter sp. NR9]SKA22943.1 mannan endo-1,4-beta-mannosidase [Fibrobacter intestinalis]
MKVSKLLPAFFAFAATAAQATIYEAESQTSSNTAAAVLDSAGVSGDKYVNANGFTFTVSVEESGIYDISTKIWVKQYDWFNTEISVNGKSVGSFLTNSPNSAFTTYILETSAKLNAGTNEIKLSGGSTNIDYLSVEMHPAIVFDIDGTPVTAGATESAYKLKAFLLQNFGSKTVSGMMIGDNAFNYDYGNMKLIEKCVPSDSCSFEDEKTTFLGQEDIRLFKERSGYNPALGGFDMLFAAGGHSDEGWFIGYTENNVRMAKELWAKGGIPAFTWHWKVGTDTVFYTKNNGFKNAGCTEGVQASSAENTCFNYTKAFKDSTCQEINPASDEYALLMADVDKLSAHFLELQEAGVAAIWRPLHEAAGGWFWWGVGGAECYKALYKLVYDRMTNTNGVKNLIWVWNIERDPAIGYDFGALNPAWYPGDEYVDIIGVDIYNNANDNSSNVKYFNKMVDELGAKKMLALTENGPIPDVDSMHTDGSVWSFWMPWYNTWGSGFLNQTSNDVWKKNLADDRILKLETMPGWENVSTQIPTSSQAGTFHISIRHNQLHFTLQESADVLFYTPTGKRIQKISGKFTAGAHSLDISKLSRGLYILQIREKGRTFSHKLLLR